jgi:DNA-directed RNA polymerase subunit RPC12/RpoP
MQKFFRLQKFDERSGTVYGVMTCEKPDKQGEIFDYDGGGKADVQRWSDEAVASTRAAGQEVSLGNIRLQHGLEIAGKATLIRYDDDAKSIGLLSQPVNDEIRDMCRGGFVRGYSIAGGYASRHCNECGADMLGMGMDCPQCGERVFVRFVPRIVECSYVDSPCLESATFEYVKSNGVSELRKFSKGSGNNMNHLQEHFGKAAEHHKKAAKCNKALAGHNRDLGKAAETRGDYAGAKTYRAIADEHTQMAAAHDQHVEQLGALASSDPDNWALGGWTIDANGNPVNGPGPGTKVAKGDDFFDRYVYGGSPQDTLRKLSRPDELDS